MPTLERMPGCDSTPVMKVWFLRDPKGGPVAPLDATMYICDAHYGTVTRAIPAWTLWDDDRDETGWGGYWYCGDTIVEDEQEDERED